MDRNQEGAQAYLLLSCSSFHQALAFPGAFTFSTAFIYLVLFSSVCEIKFMLFFHFYIFNVCGCGVVCWEMNLWPWADEARTLLLRWGPYLNFGGGGRLGHIILESQRLVWFWSSSVLSLVSFLWRPSPPWHRGTGAEDSCQVGSKGRAFCAPFVQSLNGHFGLAACPSVVHRLPALVAVVLNIPGALGTEPTASKDGGGSKICS